MYFVANLQCAVFEAWEYGLCEILYPAVIEEPTSFFHYSQSRTFISKKYSLVPF